MDFLHWQQTDKNKFAVFIRDLTQNLNNVKHMIEDSLQEEKKPIHNIKKKVVTKKKDIIIEQQTKLRLAKHVKVDLNQLDYIMDTLDIKNPYLSFSLMKTEEGLTLLKYRMLNHFWELRKDHFPHVMNLYFQLVDKEVPIEYKELFQKIQTKLDDTEYKLYMMKNLSHLLPPLNIHEPKVKKLDDWQLNVLSHIKHGESVLVKAPTSSGKSFVGLAAGIIHKKILYVCPAKPIAYQVGAHFSFMGYRVHYLLDNLCHHSYDDKTNIFVGVPGSIEDNLYKIGTTFDYAVFDEIHNLNKEDDGHIYENIIKLIQCPFLALSATIGNIDFLKDIFHKIHNKQIHYIEYTKRFINQQKMIFDNGLRKLHPLACIELKDLNENFLQQNLQFTPYDSAILWETIEEVFDLDDEDIIEEWSPDNYFDDDNSILTLDDTRDYEHFIKCKLVELSKSYPDKVKELLSKFHKELTMNHVDRDYNKDIIQLFRECKGNECLPMLAFNMDTIACKRLFTSLFETIGKAELEEYPYHYDILEKKEELYTKYEDDRLKFIEGIKIGKESKDARTDKQTKVDRYDRQQQEKYELSIQQYYQQCIHNCTRKDDIPGVIQKKQLKNLAKELKDYQRYPTFGHIDIFQKHKEFCFSNTEPMTGNQIREVRREILNTLGLKISYEHELFQLLKRGIGIYTEDMPEEYKWILQKLMDDKKIGIVISDRTLCLGIDLPIRSSLLMGLPNSYNFTTDDYLQMSGRAGRRGKDDRGYTIFYNLDYKELMKGCLPDIVGSDKAIPSNYQCLKLSKITIDEVYKNSIHMSKKEDIREYQETSDPKLQWSLRYEDNVYNFIEGITKWNKEVFNSVDKEECVLTKVLMILPYDNDTIISSYKKKVIDNDFHEYKYLCKLLQTIYNSLKDKKYIHLKGIIKQVHSTLKDMILRYQGLK
jgi:superfamily II DNA or RNA helicase